MKRFVISLALIVGVCIMSAHSLWFLTNARDTLFCLTDEIKTAYSSDDYKTAYDLSRKLANYWDGSRTTLALFFRRHQLDELSESITKLPSYIMYKEDSEILAELTRIRERINSLWKSEQPRLRSIF